MNANFMPKVFSRMPSFRSATVLHHACRALAMAAALGAGLAHADRSDRFQPLNFAADSARVDDNRGLNILSGNVEITKGSIVLRSARVEVRQQNDGTQSAVATGGQNGRAYFRQRREGLDEVMEGEAERVEYDGKNDVVRFNGRAVMRRLDGARVADEVVGPVIIYDNKTEVFQVVGNAASGSGGAASSPGGRVRGVIAPRKEVSSSNQTPDAGTRLSNSRMLSEPVLESTR
jgi:lipopolysaccharide export system protein LptA